MRKSLNIVNFGIISQMSSNFIDQWRFNRLYRTITNHGRRGKQPICVLKMNVQKNDDSDLIFVEWICHWIQSDFCTAYSDVANWRRKVNSEIM